MKLLAGNDFQPEFNDIRLECFRVYLRPPQPSDWRSWADVRERNRDHLQPFEPLWPPDSSSRSAFKKRLAAQGQLWRRDLKYSFLIFTNVQDKLIGGINLNNVCRGSARFASLGYWLDRDYEGQGYMSEAARQVLVFAFDRLALHRVNAGCILSNERSHALLLRLGFRQEGLAEKYLQINGRWQDHYLFGLNVEDWAARL